MGQVRNKEKLPITAYLPVVGVDIRPYPEMDYDGDEVNVWPRDDQDKGHDKVKEKQY